MSIIANYGEVHFFYPCVIKSDDDLESIEQCILRGTLYAEKHRLAIKKSLDEKMEELFNALDNLDGAYTIDDAEDIPVPDEIMSMFADDENDYTLVIQEESPKIYLQSEELSALSRKGDKFTTEKDTAITVYGIEYANSHIRFLLVPMKVRLINGTQVYMQCILYLFENNTAILKFELPIIDIEMELLTEGNIDTLVESFSFRWIMESLSDFASMHDLAKEYLAWMGQEIDADIVIFGDHITNIILIDTADKFGDVSQIEDNFQEMLFRIIAAPVPLRKSESCLDIAKSYLQKSLITHFGIGYIIKSTGGCLSVIDEATFRKSLSDLHFEELPLRGSQDYYEFMSYLTLKLSVNVEFSLILSLLTKISNRNMLFKSLDDSGDFDETKMSFLRKSNVPKYYSRALLCFCY